MVGVICLAINLDKRGVLCVPLVRTSALPAVLLQGILALVLGVTDVIVIAVIPATTIDTDGVVDVCKVAVLKMHDVVVSQVVLDRKSTRLNSSH